MSAGRRLTTPLACLAVGALAALAIVAFANANGGGSGSVAFCAAGKAGKLTLAKNGKCGPGARKIAIAKQGPRGKAGGPGSSGPTGPAGADATVAALAPEPVRFVRTAGASGSCATDPGSFCAYSAVKFDNVGGAYAKVGYRKDSSGFVHLQGLTDYACINNCNGILGGNIIFYLPSAYAPTGGKLEFPIGRCTDHLGQESGDVRSVLVSSDGAVTINDACSASSLDGITFHP